MSSRTTAEKIRDELHPLARTVLDNRNIDDLDVYLSPQYDEVLHDPYLFRQMQDFVNRIHQAVENEERIVVFSDFDTDGIPAAVMWHDFFGEIEFENFEIYIPKRDIEGFGLKPEQVKGFAADDTDLIITVDCGIRSHEAIEAAKAAGMDVVILDHHVAAETNPPADIIINPALEEEIYPFKKLCGAGVVFKCLQAFEADDRFDLPKNFTKGQLGMAAIATISDMVPLVGENRVLAHFGLKILRQTTRPGLRELYQKGRIQGRELTEVDIGFTIGSHINAASRLDQPYAAFNLLTTRNHQEGKELAKELNRLYRERKRRTAKLKLDVAKITDGISDEAAITIGSDEWKPALLGPVAHGLSDAYDRPVFLWGKMNGRRKGSARAGRHNVVGMLQALDDSYLNAYGGHEMAGGFEIGDVDPDDLAAALSSVASDHEIDGYGDGDDPVNLQLSDISWNLYQSLEKIGPFGVGNEAPMFRLTDVNVDGKRIFGAGNEHVSLTLTDGDSEHETICFFADKQMKEVKSGQSVAVTGAIEKTTFGFRRQLRFRMEEITIL